MVGCSVRVVELVFVRREEQLEDVLGVWCPILCKNTFELDDLSQRWGGRDAGHIGLLWGVELLSVECAITRGLLRFELVRNHPPRCGWCWVTEEMGCALVHLLLIT